MMRTGKRPFGEAERLADDPELDALLASFVPPPKKQKTRPSFEDNQKAQNKRNDENKSPQSLLDSFTAPNSIEEERESLDCQPEKEQIKSGSLRSYISNGVDLDSASCLSFGSIDKLCRRESFTKLIRDSLQKYGNRVHGKCGVFDVQFHRNRQLSGKWGFADVYFENRHDAELIHSLCESKTLVRDYNWNLVDHSKRYNRCNGSNGRRTRKVSCRWTEDFESENTEYMVDAELKGLTAIIKLSNLEWNETIWSIRDEFKRWGTESETMHFIEEDSMDIDVEPRWIKLLEDRNGFFRCMALVEMSDAETAEYVVEKFNGRKMSGREIKMEFSCFDHNGPPFYHFDRINQSMAGKTRTILLGNLCADLCDVNDVRDHLLKVTGWTLSNIATKIKDLYLIHAVDRVKSGKCWVRFCTTESAAECMQYLAKGGDLKIKNMECARSVLAYFVNDEAEKEDQSHCRGRTDRLVLWYLPWNANEQTVRDLFEECKGNDIISVKMDVAPSGYPEGECIVRFSRKEAAAIAMDNFRKRKKEKSGNDNGDDSDLCRRIYVDFRKIEEGDEYGPQYDVGQQLGI